MFRVNAWAIPYAAPLIGSKLVFGGPLHDPSSIYELIESEGVHEAGGVPDDLARAARIPRRAGKRVQHVRSLRVAAPPPARDDRSASNRAAST